VATGDIVQAVGWLSLGSATIGISDNEAGPTTIGSDGPDAPWATPTSGNTLIVLIVGESTVSSFTGWTQRYASTGDALKRYIYEKTSDGSESSFSATMASSSLDTVMGAWEVEGSVTWDVASSGYTASGNSISSGTTATLASATSVALAAGFHWRVGDTSFSNSFTKDFDYQGGTHSQLFYHGGSHRVLDSTSGIATAASWAGTASSGTCIVGVWSVAASATPTPNDLTATGTFPTVTASGDVNAATTVTSVAATSVFPAVTEQLDQTLTPVALFSLVSFPTVLVCGAAPATTTPTALPAGGTFPTAVPEAIDGVIATGTVTGWVVSTPERSASSSRTSASADG
jgi:hypothetical protein